MSTAQAKEIAETAALFFAGVFFLYKFIAGYFVTNLSLALTASSQSNQALTGILVVAVKLIKGDRGSMDLHDARVRVIWEGGEAESEVIGGDHRTFKTQQIGNLSRKIVNFSARSTQSPLLRLTPGEETTLSAHFEVPADVTCAVEVAILGSRPRWFLARTFFKPVIGQWRASIVSLPERTHNQERPN